MLSAGEIEWELLSESCVPPPSAVTSTTQPNSYPLTEGLNAVLGEEI